MLNKGVRIWVVAILILGQAQAAWGEGQGDEGVSQPLQEVFQTEVVYPQEKGEVQLTLSPRYQEGDSQDQIILPLTIEYGLTDAWQIELEWDAFSHRNPTTGANTNGIGDLEFGTKYSFMNVADSNFHIAPGLGFGFPVGDPEKGLGEGMLEMEPFVSMAYDLPNLNNSQIFTQVAFGYVNRLRGDEEEAHEITWNAGFFIPVGPVRLTSEFNWSTNKWNDGDEDNRFITPGFVWDLPGTWEVGAGAPIGLNSESDNFRLIGMLTYEFDVLSEE